MIMLACAPHTFADVFTGRDQNLERLLFLFIAGVAIVIYSLQLLIARPKGAQRQLINLFMLAVWFFVFVRFEQVMYRQDAFARRADGRGHLAGYFKYYFSGAHGAIILHYVSLAFALLVVYSVRQLAKGLRDND